MKLTVKLLLVILLSTVVFANIWKTTIEKSKLRFVGGQVNLVGTDKNFRVLDFPSSKVVVLECTSDDTGLKLPYELLVEILATEGTQPIWVIKLSQGVYSFQKVE